MNAVIVAVFFSLEFVTRMIKHANAIRRCICAIITKIQLVELLEDFEFCLRHVRLFDAIDPSLQAVLFAC